MLKLVIVDDEPLVLRGIRKMIEQMELPLIISGVAYDGEEALEIIEATRPDAVLVDIQMPIMDGLELIAQLDKRNVKVIPIILSGYQNFEYAQVAMKKGVMDYLLKPVSPVQLRATLAGLCEKAQASKETERLRILMDVISGEAHDSLSMSAEIRDLFAGYDHFSAALICAGSYCIFPCNRITPAKEFWLKTDVETIARELSDASERVWILDGKQQNEKLILCGSVEKKKTDFFHKLHSRLKDFDFPITTAVGAQVDSPNELARETTLLRISLYKRIIYGASRFIDCGESMDDAGTGAALDANTRKMMSIYLETGRADMFKEELRKLFDRFQAEKIMQIHLERFLKYFLNFYTEKMTFISETRIAEAELEINEMISNNHDYQAIFESFNVLLADLYSSNRASMPDMRNDKILAEKINDYIILNYSLRAPIQALTAFFSMTAPYLSSVYKKVYGTTPNKQISRLRMEKAQELLLSDSPLSISDIADAVGFDDPLYFSRVFKMATGKNPTEFKTNHKAKEL